MHITFCDINPNVTNAISDLLDKHPTKFANVSVVTQDILTLDVEAYVSPANSFGYMDGGIDLAYLNTWPLIEKQVMATIKERYPLGECLVGDAFTIVIQDTYATNRKYLIVAPTMRMPRPIKNLDDVYLATRAAIYEAREVGFQSIAIPGMGTLTGNVAPDVAANLMIQGMIDALNAPIRK